MKDARGFALVITLLITALLVALSVEFVDEVFVDTSARQNFTDGQQAGIMADSGIEAGTKLLQLGLAKQDYTSLTDLELIAKMLHMEDEKGKIQVTVEEESGKLNLNALINNNGTLNEQYHPIAERLFKKLKLPQELLDSVIDWIDKNEEPMAGGAETSYYSTLKPPYGSKNAGLETVEELRLIKGFDARTLERLRPFITVYADQPGIPTFPININTAAKELIASLDDSMTESLAQQIIDERKIKPFKTSTDLGNRVSGMTTLSSKLASDNRIMQNEKGAVYRIISQATVNETTRVVETVIRPGGLPPVIYWREY